MPAVSKAQQESQRVWREKNREKLRLQARTRYEKNRERFAAEALERYRKNPERNKAASKRWKQSNKERVAIYARQNSAKHHYGLSFEEFQQLSETHPRCAICGSLPNGRDLDIDHCHRTGKVRAKVCNRCNRLIALMESAGDEIVAAVQQYVRSHASNE